MHDKHLLLYADNTAKLREVMAKRLKGVSKSQNDLCDITRVAASTLSRWEESAPNTSTLLKLEKQLAAWEKGKMRAIRQSSASSTSSPRKGSSAGSKSNIENPSALA